MMKRWLLLLLLLPAVCWGATIDIDLDNNDAVDIGFGGTNSTTAADARTALGLAIGTDIQAYSYNTNLLASPTSWRLFYVGADGALVELELGSAGTYLKSQGASSAPIFDTPAGSGNVGGSTGSTDNAILRADGAGGNTLQNSFVTIDDSGSINIPVGQTYKINGVAHTHNYQPSAAALTTYSGLPPSANASSLLVAADYSAMRTLLSLVPGTNIQAYDADLATLAAPTPWRLFYSNGSSAITELALGSAGTVLTSQGASAAPQFSAAASGAWSSLSASAADATIPLGGYKTIWTSTLNSAGANFTLTNTTSDLTADVSFFDFKYTDNADANGYYLRGYDNVSTLRWYIGNSGWFYGYAFETVQGATAGSIDFLEGSSNGTNKITVVGQDSLSGDFTQTLQAATGTLPLRISSGTKALATSEIASGACSSAQSATATGTVTTDLVGWGFNGDPTGVTGYMPTTGGMLTIIAYPSTDSVNFKVCNNTLAAITPGAITLNWKIIR